MKVLLLLSNLLTDVLFQVYPVDTSRHWGLGACMVRHDASKEATKAKLTTFFFYSSAKDQISKQTCAVKKLASPFKHAVIAQHMFREIKLLRQLQHDNVCSLHSSWNTVSNQRQIIHLNDIFISPSEDMYVLQTLLFNAPILTRWYSYLVTDLMSIDLHTLLKSRRMDNQFTQYFLYQIMVSHLHHHYAIPY